MKKSFMVKESELDDVQRNLIDNMFDKNIIVSGCAGSGKSVIALHKAKRVQNENKGSCEVVVFTKALRGFMASGISELRLNCPFYYHWEWKYRAKMPTADYVIVDEIQDFSVEEIQEFIKSARKNFIFFGDTAQSIYSNKSPLAVGNIKNLNGLNNNWNEFKLDYNYRLPKPVAQITQDYIGVGVERYGDGLNYKSEENEIPRILQYDTFEEQLDAIVRIIRNKSLTDVGILVPNNDLIPRVLKSLKEADEKYVSSNNSSNINKLKFEFKCKVKDKEDSERSMDIDRLNFSTDNPKVMTYHSAKGLQFETVFLPGVDNPTDGNWQKALYVAMTRTYRNLYVMYTGVIPAILQQIPKDLYKDKETDEIEDF